MGTKPGDVGTVLVAVGVVSNMDATSVFTVAVGERTVRMIIIVVVVKVRVLYRPVHYLKSHVVCC